MEPVKPGLYERKKLGLREDRSSLAGIGPDDNPFFPKIYQAFIKPTEKTRTLEARIICFHKITAGICSNFSLMERSLLALSLTIFASAVIECDDKTRQPVKEHDRIGDDEDPVVD